MFASNARVTVARSISTVSGRMGLVSLDAPMFADSSVTLRDTIAHWLWD
jgi:hypothetical protein